MSSPVFWDRKPQHKNYLCHAKFLVEMTISYKWLNRYLPEEIPAERLSKILTSIGLEVESLDYYSTLKSSLEGLIVGKVLTCEKHSGADKLKVTTVNVGEAEPLQIVCGAANVEAGQKVVVALVGTTIHPTTGESFSIKKAKIRGEESSGMLCAEDEIGLGTSHDGIMVLPEEAVVGTPVADLYENYEDHIFEIGLTPNRMDAMSHMGVAKDVLAYLNHHEKKSGQLKNPTITSITNAKKAAPVSVQIENTEACKRYSGVTIKNIKVAESPVWLKQLLQAIGIQPINNIVDITNFILHDTGQPLHAFDLGKITGNGIRVKNLPEGTAFITLDNKERKLKADDLVICNAVDEPMCIAGIYGGAGSGITEATTNIFLESAWFSPSVTRRSSLSHGLRTDAASRFEKGVDISNTLKVVKQATALILEIAGGETEGDFVDQYPKPVEPAMVKLKYHYLKKLSGKNYHGDTVKNILGFLGFTIMKDDIDELTIEVPLSKPDISIPADIVEEIMRIDGLDNIEIPTVISISPSVNEQAALIGLREKIAGQLTGMGFHEVFTNSITNSKYYDDATLGQAVKMLNNLSADLDIMRPQMLQTGLEVIAYNKNRRSKDLRLFEMGKTYSTVGNKYLETKHLSLYITGNVVKADWQQKEQPAGFYDLKSVCSRLFELCNIQDIKFEPVEAEGMLNAAKVVSGSKKIAVLGEVNNALKESFGIKDPVFYADILWDDVLELYSHRKITYKEITKYPAVERDLALIVDKEITYNKIEEAIAKTAIPHLQKTKLFDVFVSDKLGEGKKSMAVNFTFLNESKTLTDEEIDRMVSKLLQQLKLETGAEIRQ